jgi:hypothetical protein
MRAIVPLNKMVSAWSEKITLVAVSGLAKMAKMANHWARGLIVKAQKLDVVAGIQIRDAGISLIGGSLGGWRVKNEHIRAPPAIDRIAPMPACRKSMAWVLFELNWIARDLSISKNTVLDIVRRSRAETL